MKDNAKLFSPGFFGRIFNRLSNWTLDLSAPSPTLVLDGRHKSIELQAILSARVEDGYVWSTIKIGPLRLEGLTISRRVELSKAAQDLADHLRRQQENGARRKEAEELARLKLEEEERRIKAEVARLRADFEKLAPSLDRLSVAYDELLDRGLYIREYFRNDFLSKWQGDIGMLPVLATVLDHPLFQHEKQATAQTAHRRLIHALTSPYVGITNYNSQFIKSEKIQWADFFKIRWERAHVMYARCSQCRSGPEMKGQSLINRTAETSDRLTAVGERLLLLLLRLNLRYPFVQHCPLFILPDLSTYSREIFQYRNQIAMAMPHIMVQDS